ncbi:Mariner Mos1 transposase [Eumeta japonica]|uniref:Mariner Mos1 transposase n=1 Tax=Eumeta variegata TaxID=151549 RepID=A0A4C1XT05_EUMVA|nr:Mariner Mos1 transposase [Eumeta japonica]
MPTWICMYLYKNIHTLDLPHGFLGFSPGPRGLKAPPAKSKDKDRSGRPKIYDDAELDELLEEDSSQTQKELALTLEVARRAVEHRLKSLGMIHKQGDRVPSWGRQRRRRRRPCKVSRCRIEKLRDVSPQGGDKNPDSASLILRHLKKKIQARADSRAGGPSYRRTKTEQADVGSRVEGSALLEKIRPSIHAIIKFKRCNVNRVHACIIFSLYASSLYAHALCWRCRLWQKMVKGRTHEEIEPCYGLAAAGRYGRKVTASAVAFHPVRAGNILMTPVASGGFMGCDNQVLSVASQAHLPIEDATSRFIKSGEILRTGLGSTPSAGLDLESRES